MGCLPLTNKRQINTRIKLPWQAKIRFDMIEKNENIFKLPLQRRDKFA